MSYKRRMSQLFNVIPIELQLSCPINSFLLFGYLNAGVQISYATQTKELYSFYFFLAKYYSINLQNIKNIFFNLKESFKAKSLRNKPVLFTARVTGCSSWGSLLSFLSFLPFFPPTFAIFCKAEPVLSNACNLCICRRRTQSVFPHCG